MSWVLKESLWPHKKTRNCHINNKENTSYCELQGKKRTECPNTAIFSQNLQITNKFTKTKKVILWREYHMKKRSIYEIDIKVPGDLGSEVTTKRFDKVDG